MATNQKRLIKEVMTHKVETIPPTATSVEAAVVMKRLNVGSLPVCDGEHLLGMVTDRDLVLRIMAEGRDPKTTKVREATSTGVHYCYDDQTVEEAAQLMEREQVRRLLILNREKRLVGIVSLGDVAVKTDHPAATGEALEGISQPARPERKAV